VPIIVETLPEELHPEIEAALAWLNAERSTQYQVTGVVDPDATLAARSAASRGGGAESYALGLVLCEGDHCLREQLTLQPTEAGFAVSLAAPEPGAPRPIPPTLDPPAGVRSDWLDTQLAQHAFVLLVFYRGFW